MVNAVKLDMIRLHECFNHDEPKQQEIAQDWMDYLEVAYNSYNVRC